MTADKHQLWQPQATIRAVFLNDRSPPSMIERERWPASWTGTNAWSVFNRRSLARSVLTLQ